MVIYWVSAADKTGGIEAAELGLALKDSVHFVLPSLACDSVLSKVSKRGE